MCAKRKVRLSIWFTLSVYKCQFLIEELFHSNWMLYFEYESEQVPSILCDGLIHYKQKSSMRPLCTIVKPKVKWRIWLSCCDLTIIEHWKRKVTLYPHPWLTFVLFTSFFSHYSTFQNVKLFSKKMNPFCLLFLSFARSFMCRRSRFHIHYCKSPDFLSWNGTQQEGSCISCPVTLSIHPSIGTILCAERWCCRSSLLDWA